MWCHGKRPRLGLGITTRHSKASHRSSAGLNLGCRRRNPDFRGDRINAQRAKELGFLPKCFENWDGEFVVGVDKCTDRKN